jgi:hypothetical protein
MGGDAAGSDVEKSGADVHEAQSGTGCPRPVSGGDGGYAMVLSYLRWLQTG